MGYDKAVDSARLDAALGYTADRIRLKTGGSADLDFDLDGGTGFGNDVDGIETDGKEWTWMNDGNMHLWLEVVDDRLTPVFTFNTPNGAVTIDVDWGDNSTETISVATGNNKTISHTYSQAGAYRVDLVWGSVTGTRGIALQGMAIMYKSVLKAAEIRIDEENYSISLTGNCFQRYPNLKHLWLQDGTGNANYPYDSNPNLLSIRLPQDKATPAYLYGDENLRSIEVPAAATTIPSGFLQYCYLIRSVTIPVGVESIGATAFSNMFNLRELHLLPTSPPTLSNTNAFTSTPSDLIIYVPFSADHSVLTAYQEATNWSAFVSQMQEEPQS